jgi:AcrR family transcriptional regulator
MARDRNEVVHKAVRHHGRIEGMTWDRFLERARNYTPSETFRNYLSSIGVNGGKILTHSGKIDLIAWFGDTLARGLKEGDIRPADIQYTLLAGGSSQWPFVDDIVRRELSLSEAKVMRSDRPYTVISEGLSILPALQRRCEVAQEILREQFPQFCEQQLKPLIESRARGLATQIADAVAIDLFDETGFQKTRISDIVAKAGVAQGTFYLYYKSKEDIFLDICAEFITLFSTFLEDASDLFAGGSYDEVRRNVLDFNRKLIALYTANGKIARILFREGAGQGGPFKQFFHGIYNQFIDIVRQRLEQNQATGHVNFEDAETEAAFLIGLFDRSLFYFMDIKKSMDIEALSRRMTDFIMGGLSKKHKP